MFDVYILMFMSAILIYLAINYKFNKQEFDKQISNSSKNRISKEYLVKIKKELFEIFDDDYLNKINEKKNKKWWISFYTISRVGIGYGQRVTLENGK